MKFIGKGFVIAVALCAVLAWQFRAMADEPAAQECLTMDRLVALADEVTADNAARGAPAASALIAIRPVGDEAHVVAVLYPGEPSGLVWFMLRGCVIQGQAAAAADLLPMFTEADRRKWAAGKGRAS